MAIFPGLDASGNGNDWTTNNINNTDSTATTYDIMTDVPTLTDEDTANYCTLNPLNALIVAPYGVLDANLTYTSHTATWRASGATIYPTTGKWYYEGFFGTLGSGSYLGIGLKIPGPVGAEYSGQTANSWGILGNNTYLATHNNNVATNIVNVAITTSTAVQVAVDFDAGKMWFGYNNNWSASGNPSTGANPIYTFTPNTQLQPILSAYNCVTYINFGQRPFAYTPPTGYLKLNTFNLPDSSIVDGSTNFDIVTYAGNSGTNTITELDFQPDFTWIKSTSNSASHSLIDSVRGYYNLRSNSTIAEFSNSGFWDGFNSNGFNLIGPEADANSTGYSYVAWNWKANGTAVSNTDGTITSSVSANSTAGFSVVTYTGNGTAGATIGHGLGVAPNVIIVKGTDAASAYNWMVYTSVLGRKYAYLNLTNAFEGTETGTSIWASNPTSNVFSVSNNVNVNVNTAGYLAYCWSEVEGYSKFGSYTGNGSTNGPFIYTGFRPAFVMFKTTTIIGHWVIVDTERSTYNVIDDSLYPDTSGSEINTITDVDFLSNGFKWRGVLANETNVNGQVYIYMAFAENPFKNSLAR